MLHIDLKFLQILLGQLGLQPKRLELFPEDFPELILRHRPNLWNTAYKYHRELAVLAKNQGTG